MKKNFLQLLLTLCILTCPFLASAQITANVGVNGEYAPNAFLAYRATPTTGTLANGIFTVVITKSGADMPANSFSIIVSLAPDVAYTGAAFDVPAGFTFTAISPISLVFKQTGAYAGSGIPARKVINIPVQATKAVPVAGANNWLVEVQQEADYTDAIPSNDSAKGRVSVASTPLPVTLISFNAVKENNTANLSWSTSSEVNSDRFEVQQSVDAKQWKVVGTVESNKNSKIRQDYSFSHNTPSQGDNYYRLKMIDSDETFAFSSIKSVSFEQVLNLMVYPNPVSNVVKIDMKDLNLAKSVMIYSLNGSKVYEAGSNISNSIDVRGLANGNYLMTVGKADGSYSTTKFAVNH